jgi:hypothetical protein
MIVLTATVHQQRIGTTFMDVYDLPRLVNPDAQA